MNLLLVGVKGCVGEAFAVVLSEEHTVTQTDMIHLITRTTAVHPLPLLWRLLALSERDLTCYWTICPICFHWIGHNIKLQLRYTDCNTSLLEFFSMKKNWSNGYFVLVRFNVISYFCSPKLDLFDLKVQQNCEIWLKLLILFKFFKIHFKM